MPSLIFAKSVSSLSNNERSRLAAFSTSNSMSVEPKLIWFFQSFHFKIGLTLHQHDELHTFGQKLFHFHLISKYISQTTSAQQLVNDGAWKKDDKKDKMFLISRVFLLSDAFTEFSLRSRYKDQINFQPHCKHNKNNKRNTRNKLPFCLLIILFLSAEQNGRSIFREQKMGWFN